MSILEKVLKYRAADFELWVEVNKILGFENIEECADWPVRDSVVDDHPSLEIICKSDFEGINREQADKLLALGFKWIFQVIGTKGEAWDAHGVTNYVALESDKDKRQLQRYKNEINKLNGR